MDTFIFLVDKFKLLITKKSFPKNFIDAMESKVTKDLIFKYFSKETSAIQKRMIDEWVLKIENEEQFYKWLDEYELLNPEYNVNIDKAVANYHYFVESNTQKTNLVETNNFQEIRKSTWNVWASAASLVIMFGFFTYLSKGLLQFKTYQTAYGETKSFQLPDGSLVKLNANSSLRVPRWGFGEKSRIVYLNGEASFSVIHTLSNQKFIVQTPKKFEVEVLGTEFSVFARPRGSKVVLNKGKVQVNLHNGNTLQKLIMKPGELLTLDNQNHLYKKTVSRPESYQAAIDQHYVFDRTTLQEIIFLLAENYGIIAEVTDQELLNQTLTGTYTAKDANELLDLLKEVLDVNIKWQKDKIIIEKNS